jgi:PRC-barrel domain
MAETISWVATVATIVAAFMTASNLGSRVTGFGFAVFTLGALCWIGVGVLTEQPALLWTNVVLTVLDIFGVWRWLGRQARVEEGARSASVASERTPGEALFPVSLLGRAPVHCGDEEVGRCIDAMAGCRSGRVDYLVVSEGGVAGVGERLRRVSWNDVHVDGEGVVAHFGADRFNRLEELERDQWPGR